FAETVFANRSHSGCGTRFEQRQFATRDQQELGPHVPWIVMRVLPGASFEGRAGFLLRARATGRLCFFDTSLKCTIFPFVLQHWASSPRRSTLCESQDRSSG